MHQTQFNLNRKPTIALLLIVRDEVDIVTQCISWHLNRGIDCALVIDNGSTDGTRDLLSQYSAEDSVLVFDEPDGFDKPTWWRRLADIGAERFNADWVMPVDADEFWFAKDGNYRTELTGPHNVISSAWRNMIPDPGKHWWQFDHYGNLLNYAGIFKKNLIAYDPSLMIDRGNHEPLRENRFEKVSTNLIAYHYPVRSWEQFEKKVKRVARTLSGPPQDHPFGSFHWKRWHVLHQEGKLRPLFDQVLGQRSGVCTYDPTMTRLLGQMNLSATSAAPGGTVYHPQTTEIRVQL